MSWSLLRHRSARVPSSLAALLLLALVGCGAAPPTLQLQTSAGVTTGDSTAATGATGGVPDVDATTLAVPSPTRRVIYEATLELEVDSLEDFQRKLPERIREHGGYVSDARVNRSPGARPDGRWVVRVPVERFEAFLHALGEQGYARRLNQTSQEVTQEYVDLEARIANTRRLEERVTKLLENSKGELNEIVRLENELARVHGEVELLEGRRRLLENRTALSTVTIEARERAPYVAPEPPPPTFGERLGATWRDSLGQLVVLGQHVLLGVVAFAPWCGVLLLVAGPVGLCAWRLGSPRRARSES